MKKIIILIISSIVLFGCNPQPSGNGETPDGEEEDVCSCPHATICLQPYEDFTKKEALKLVPKLEEEFGTWLYGGWNFEVLDPIPLPKESFVSQRNRYRVTPILNLQRKNLKGDEIIIGLTHKDICADLHDTKDYGIIGMSRLHKQVCVVSDKRLKNKSDYWKPILHEFMHTFYGSPHCPEDDPNCFMKDAKGHANFGIQNKLCDSCRQ